MMEYKDMCPHSTRDASCGRGRSGYTTMDPEEGLQGMASQPPVTLREGPLATDFYRQHFARKRTDPLSPLLLGASILKPQPLGFYRRGFEVVHAVGEIWPGYSHLFNFDRIPPTLRPEEWADLEHLLLKQYEDDVGGMSFRLVYSVDWTRKEDYEGPFVYNLQLLTRFFRGVVSGSIKALDSDDILAKLLKIKIEVSFMYQFGMYDFEHPARVIPEVVSTALQKLLEAYAAYVEFVFADRTRSHFVKQLILHYDIRGDYDYPLAQFEDPEDIEESERTPSHIIFEERYQMPSTAAEMRAWRQVLLEDPLWP